MSSTTDSGGAVSQRRVHAVARASSILGTGRWWVVQGRGVSSGRLGIPASTGAYAPVWDVNLAPMLASNPISELPSGFLGPARDLQLAASSLQAFESANIPETVLLHGTRVQVGRGPRVQLGGGGGALPRQVDECLQP